MKISALLTFYFFFDLRPLNMIFQFAGRYQTAEQTKVPVNGEKVFSMVFSFLLRPLASILIYNIIIISNTYFHKGYHFIFKKFDPVDIYCIIIHEHPSEWSRSCSSRVISIYILWNIIVNIFPHVCFYQLTLFSFFVTHASTPQESASITTILLYLPNVQICMNPSSIHVCV